MGAGMRRRVPGILVGDGDVPSVLSSEAGKLFLNTFVGGRPCSSGAEAWSVAGVVTFQTGSGTGTATDVM